MVESLILYELEPVKKILGASDGQKSTGSATLALVGEKINSIFSSQ